MNLPSVSCFFLLCALSPTMNAQRMDNRELGRIIATVADSLEGAPGAWQFLYADRLMIIFSDEDHDRMRIISPIGKIGDIPQVEQQAAMIANFHSALDARYAVSEDIMWAAYIHPLQSLSKEQVRDGLLQVYRAASTFGTTYSSTELVFPFGGNTRRQHDGVNKM